MLDRTPLPLTVTGLSGTDFLRDMAAGILAPLPGPSLIEGSTNAAGQSFATPVVAFAMGSLALLLLLGWLGLRRMRHDGPILFECKNLMTVYEFRRQSFHSRQRGTNTSFTFLAKWHALRNLVEVQKSH